MNEPIEITPEELEQITTFWEITVLTAKRNLSVIKNNLHQESGNQIELLQEVRKHSVRAQELLEGIHTSLKEVPKGFVKATIYGVLPKRESHIGICLLTENEEKLRFFVPEEDIESMLNSVVDHDTPTPTSHQADQTHQVRCR
ncbi:hypothetical protein [Vibrio natriegens]|uniref:Uncharacterized protein n=1 Tax=Vibrio natriegens NBRC 15636 = ATCC 14048 = DSM 759 TaxID=1219067 RepID=A0AAN0Y1T3_VIBNA|nr:hypothetical protein [Vibrio natriegens]ALR15751.1 hypothetical protein PN96_07040 [Vibrio natriegens NBRC 15636 = ATCC 14048 = DSM 759]ANQ12390.1 hypothetical protein BA890_06310 [Vibrio natriegens NBRC 15636 = ATCC 14048 = DSM 759]EPM42454.1 hypothetical protein M272_00350 [Vibrio natriegens NBRC 15636 = ATCC 14048 = DSM 759]MDX6026769.1 hypothetical protein [Vibrio natriegens NBRC 15636 = ATCC 14048 = DSM 759]UUI12851.1 hypothetical protein NP431_06310 [Vibrio natriegens]